MKAEPYTSNWALASYSKRIKLEEGKNLHKDVQCNNIYNNKKEGREEEREEGKKELEVLVYFGQSGVLGGIDPSPEPPSIRARIGF